MLRTVDLIAAETWLCNVNFDFILNDYTYSYTLNTLFLSS